METCYLITLFSTLASLCSLCFTLCTAVDSIAPAQTLIYGETLVSSGDIFELGFFSPVNSNNTYLGIWYKVTPHVVVWVANRDNPLLDSHAQLIINNKGALLLLNQTRSLVWSSNTSIIPKNPIAQILDSGNFVVRSSTDSASLQLQRFVWQSFDYPTDTLLPGMKLGWNLNTGLQRYLSSWKSPDDPSTSDFTFWMNLTGLPQLMISKGSTTKFSSGPWNGVRFSGLLLSKSTAFKEFFVFNENESYYKAELGDDGVILRVEMNVISGLLSRYLMPNKSNKWGLMHAIPYEECQNYGHCGPNGICITTHNPVCECFQGFKPSSPNEWALLADYSNGCKREVPLDCKKGEGFVKIEAVKLPDLTHIWLNKTMTSLKECKELCLKNCSCTAFANTNVTNGGSGCLMWFGDLMDTRELRVDGSEQDLYVRLAASEMRLIQDVKRKRRLKIILVAPIIASMFCILGLTFWCIIRKRRRKLRGSESKKEDTELPLFDLATVHAATNNFSPTCLIGAGGFGLVYRGKLATGEEVAVKRLSKNSGQGLNEFKNEVQLIAKLQHRNLVALLGCCMEREERVLIYEYMPNKSLDNFIFGDKRSKILGWKQHFDIIMGIARGLIYLHRDSKLRIIHRDLKASNILLDKNMNPKISDFGLARIFGEGENEARTRRVVGTYGYMSPEYAIDGKLSTKLDVFSFGVLLLEIMSGKKNRTFCHPNHHHNLLGHDRPAMSLVVFMLENEEAMLPQPKQPGFFTERSSNDESSMSNSERYQSKNSMTITILNSR